MKRFTAYLAAAAAAFVFLALALGGSRRLAEVAIAIGLRSGHLPSLAFEVNELSWGRLELYGIRSESGDLRADRVDVRWTWRDLAARRVDSVSVEGLALRARLDAGGLHLASLDRWLASRRAPVDGERALPLRRFTLRGGEAWVDTPSGALRIAAAIDLSAAPGLIGDADLSWHLADEAPGRARVACDAQGGCRGRLHLVLPRSAVAAWSLPQAERWPAELEVSLEGQAGLREPAPLADWWTALATLAPAIPGVFALDVRARDLRGIDPSLREAHLAGTLTLAEGALRFRSERAEVRAGDGPPTEGRLAFAARPRGEGGAALESVEVALADWATGGGRASLALRGSGWASGPAGELELDLDGELARTRHAIRNGRLRGPVRVRWDPEVLELALRDCVAFTSPDGPVTSALTLAAGTSICLATDPAAPIRVSREPAGSRAVDAHLVATVGDFALRYGATAVRGHGGALDLIAHSGAGASRGRVGFRGERLELPEARLAFTDPVLDGGWGGDRPARTFEGDVQIARLADPSSPPRFPALRGVGHFAVDARRVRFSADAADETGALRARLEGEHERRAGSGEARVRFAPISFGERPEAAQALARWLGGAAIERGTLAADALVHWGEGAVATSADLRVEGADFAVAKTRVEGLEGRVRLASLAPLATDGAQELRFRSAKSGVPLGAGRLVFALEREGLMQIERGEVGVAGGLLAAQGHLDFRGGPDQRLEVRIQDLQIPALLELAPVAGLQASGNLVGDLLFTVEEGRPVVRGGRIRATEGGLIRYRPDAGTAAEPGDLGGSLRSIMRDFHYEVLDMVVDGWLDERADVQAKLRGFNPAFQDGQPVHLTLNLSSAFGELIRAMPVLSAWFERLAEREVVDRDRSERLH